MKANRLKNIIKNIKSGTLYTMPKVSPLLKALPYIAMFFVVITLIMSVRGMAGNPNIVELKNNDWTADGPFELSPERGRFALMYSIVENKSVHFALDVAKFALPDLGQSNGNYVSLFAPAVSFIIIPGYLIGKMLGASQVGTFFVISLFAIQNLILISLISKRLGAHKLAGLLAGIIFLFGTPAFTYGVTLYQHHISTFAILICIYALLKWKDYKALLLILFVYPLAISVDYPNFFLMLPIALYAISYVITVKKNEDKVVVNIKPLYLLTVAAAILPILFFLGFNYFSYGNPLQLAGTISQVKDIDSNGKPAAPKDFDPTDLGLIDGKTKDNRNAVTYFNTRNMLNGFYILIFSPDRGIISFAPIILLGLIGAFIMFRSKNQYLPVLLGTFSTTLILYAMWGDPWGGWAFGARYLVPAYAILAIFLAVAISRFKKNLIFISLLIIMFFYSARINTMGAITSSRMPPKVEVLDLEKRSGQVQKYTYERNADWIKTNYVKSFAYTSHFSKSLSGTQYFWMVYSLVGIGFITALAGFIFNDEYEMKGDEK